MSGTRSPFPKAPAIEALIVAHGQPSDPASAEQALAALAAQVRACLPGARIGSATLAAPGALERAVDRAGRGALVYPMFMAAGWFVTGCLARRIAGAEARVLPPFGLDAGLVPLALRAVATAVAARGWRLSETEVLLAAHGSAKGPKAAQSAQRFAARLRHGLPGGVRVAFVEEAPFFEEVIPLLRSKALCLPFFAAEGGHVRDDVAGALATFGRGDIGLAPLGLQPGVPGLIARALRTEGLRAGAAA